MTGYRRQLPHIHPDHTQLFFTFRLYGSLPKPDSRLHLSAGQTFLHQDRMLDRAISGPLWLQDPLLADLVAQAIICGDRSRRFYDLQAWVVMPNHVHLLLLPHVEVPTITRWLKGSSARQANLLLNRTGERFWQDESWDRYLRHSNQAVRMAYYIENNPVSAGLVSTPSQWRWSSAGWHAEASAESQAFGL